MNLKDVSLSIYSFGYSAGFIHDDRPEAAPPVVSIENIADLAVAHGLGGIEFPVDRYFPAAQLGELGAFVDDCKQRGLTVAIDVEIFDVGYIRKLLPVLAEHRLAFARVKMSGMHGGNRYAEPEFTSWVDLFVSQLRSLLPELRRHGVRLLIENHQDLGSDDLIAIIDATSAEHIGINWDTGNSLAVLDTPEEFLRKSAHAIGNVHLKDYRLYRCDTGFRMARCALGEGVVDLAAVLPTLKDLDHVVPLAIELGAENCRRVEVFKPEYWEAYPSYDVASKVSFFSFLNQKLLDGDEWRSAWERDLPGAAIIESEMDDLERSVAYLERLAV